MKCNAAGPDADVNLDEIDRIVREVGGRPENVVAILHRIQEKYRYLPDIAMRRVCEVSEITPAHIAGVSTFYSQFRHEPVGKYMIRICFGTACYVLGAERIEAAIRKFLAMEEDSDTDPERLFTIQRVACIGCCSLAPCLMIEDVTYGHLTPQNAHESVENFLSAVAQRKDV